MRSSKGKSKRGRSKSLKRYNAIREETKPITDNLKKNGLALNDTKRGEMAANLDIDISKAAKENSLHKERCNGSLKSDSLSAGVTTLEQKDTVSSSVPDTKSTTKNKRSKMQKPKGSEYIAQLFEIFKNT